MSYKPQLTILIRTSQRPQQYAQCITSILEAAHACDIKLEFLIGYDTDDTLSYINISGRKYTVVDLRELRDPAKPFFYNLYLNKLLSYVHQGHCMFIDDDDTVLYGSLEFVCKHLIYGKSIIVPFMRGDFQKPTTLMMHLKVITPGYIGLPSLILWHGHKKYINFQASELADYYAIKNLSTQVELLWLRQPVVHSPRRNRGAKEI